MEKSLFNLNQNDYKSLMFPVQRISKAKKDLVKENLIKLDSKDDTYSEGSEIFTSFTIMYGAWKCNWSCPKYCYTKKLKIQGIDNDHLKQLIRIVKKRGVEFTYWPGTGELTLFRDFWDIQKFQTSISLPSIVYSNGSVFVDSELCKKELGIESSELLALMSNLPFLHIYIKFWSSDAELSRKMVGIDNGNSLPFVEYLGLNVPKAFAVLHSKFGNRIGLQTMVVPENYSDFKDNVLPYCLKQNINLFAEPVINSGNASTGFDSILSQQQLHDVKQYLASGVNYCQARQYGELILIGDKLSPGIAIPPRDADSIIDERGNLLDIESLLKDPYFKSYREMSLKENACVCREYWEQKKR